MFRRSSTVIAALVALALAVPGLAQAAGEPSLAQLGPGRAPAAKPSMPRDGVRPPAIGARLRRGDLRIPLGSRRPIAKAAVMGAGWWAQGSCNGYNATWGFTSALNTNYAGGDTYWVRFAMYQSGVGYITPWSTWLGGHQVRTSPGWTFVPYSGFYNLPRTKWVAVRMQIHGFRDGRVIRDEWLPQYDATLTDISGVYCRTRI